MSKTMSSRERMLAAITRQKPDYVPFSPWTNQAQIEDGARDAIESLGGNGGLVFGALIFEDTPPNSILMMIDAWKRYRDVRSAVAVA